MKVFFNSDGTRLELHIQVVVAGVHTDPTSWPITNDPAIVLSTHPSATKTVTKVRTGYYTVVWTALSPALAHGDVVRVAIDGAISGVAWTTWTEGIQVLLLPAIVGSGLNAGELRTAIGLSEANLDTKLDSIKLDSSKIRSKGYSRMERLYP